MHTCKFAGNDFVHCGILHIWGAHKACPAVCHPYTTSPEGQDNLGKTKKYISKLKGHFLRHVAPGNVAIYSGSCKMFNRHHSYH